MGGGTRGRSKKGRAGQGVEVVVGRRPKGRGGGRGSERSAWESAAAWRGSWWLIWRVWGRLEEVLR